MIRFFTLLLLMATAGIIPAQNIVSTEDNKWLMQEGQRLYTDGEYSTALNILNKIEKRKLTSSEVQAYELLLAKTTFGTNHLEGRALLLQYLADYPESTYRSTVAALIAESYYYAHNCELARKWFDETDFVVNHHKKSSYHTEGS